MFPRRIRIFRWIILISAGDNSISQSASRHRNPRVQARISCNSFAEVDLRLRNLRGRYRRRIRREQTIIYHPLDHSFDFERKTTIRLLLELRLYFLVRFAKFALFQIHICPLDMEKGKRSSTEGTGVQEVLSSLLILLHAIMCDSHLIVEPPRIRRMRHPVLNKFRALIITPLRIEELAQLHVCV